MSTRERSSLPHVSVVIPCCNEARHIEPCLRGILRQEPPDGGFEVLVAEGGSTDGSREIILALSREEPCVRLIDNPGRIVSTGLNEAIRAAYGEIIVRVDVHTEYAPDYLKQCCGVLAETGAANVGGPARTRGESYMQRAIAAAYHSWFSVGGARFHDVDYEGQLDTIVYGCWHKQTLFDVGLFDEELVRNQDDELNYRLRKRHLLLWQSPSIRSWYRPRASLRSLFHQYFQYGYWKVRVIQKHRLPQSLRHVMPALSVVTFSCCLAAVPFHPAASWLCVFSAGAYAAAGVGFSLKVSADSGWELIPALPLVFLHYHLGYALGFLTGLFDFYVRRKGPRPAMTVLTRPVENTAKTCQPTIIES